MLVEIYMYIYMSLNLKEEQFPTSLEVAYSRAGGCGKGARVKKLCCVL